MIISDLDGTLFDNRHRTHLLPTKDTQDHTSAWRDFNMACINDTPLVNNIALHNAYEGRKLLLTGRAEYCQMNTELSLRNAAVLYDWLIMRPDNCHARGDVFKSSVLAKLFAHRIQPVEFTFMDDDQLIIDMVRREYPHAHIVQVPSLCAAVINR